VDLTCDLGVCPICLDTVYDSDKYFHRGRGCHDTYDNLFLCRSANGSKQAATVVVVGGASVVAGGRRALDVMVAAILCATAPASP
jgi:hypothetical protein